MKTRCSKTDSARTGKACIITNIQVDLFIKHLFCVYHVPDTMLVAGEHDIRRFAKCFIEQKKVIQIIFTLLTLKMILSPCHEAALSQVVAVLLTAQS